MNKKFIFVIIMLLSISIVSYGICTIFNTTEVENKKVATSFYPTYLITKNLLKDVPKVDVVNIADKVQGCVHNFQLTPKNMKTLEKSDVLIINGMGMENYISEVIGKVSNIKIIDSSVNIDGIEVDENDHHHHHHEHEKEEYDYEYKDKHNNDEEYNSHIWMSIDRYKKQVKNIADGLIKLNYLNEDKIKENEENYLKQIEELEKIKQDVFENIANKKIKTITFHDSFTYLLEDFNIEVLKNLDIENEAGLSAHETKEAIKLINENNIKYIIADNKLKKEIPETLEKETGARVIYLNALLENKEDDLNSYIKGMKENFEKLYKIGE